MVFGGRGKRHPARDDDFILRARANNWSQRRIADALGADHVSVGKWLNELGEPRAAKGGSPRKLPGRGIVKLLLQNNVKQAEIAKLYNVSRMAVSKQRMLAEKEEGVGPGEGNAAARCNCRSNFGHLPNCAVWGR